MKRPKLGNPTDQRHFDALCAIARRQMRYQRLLWQKLRAIMAEGRKAQGDDWRQRYVDLLERATRHEERIARTNQRGIVWIATRRMKPKAPKLHVVRAAGPAKD